MPRYVDKQPNKLALQQSNAKTQLESNAESLRDNHSGTLQDIVSALEEAEKKRKEAVENLSDRLVSIQDPTLLVNDVLAETKRKIAERNLGTEEGQETVGVLKTLAAAYSVVSEWEPAAYLSPSVPM